MERSLPLDLPHDMYHVIAGHLDVTSLRCWRRADPYMRGLCPQPPDSHDWTLLCRIDKKVPCWHQTHPIVRRTRFGPGALNEQSKWHVRCDFHPCIHAEYERPYFHTLYQAAHDGHWPVFRTCWNQADVGPIGEKNMFVRNIKRACAMGAASFIWSLMEMHRAGLPSLYNTGHNEQQGIEFYHLAGAQGHLAFIYEHMIIETTGQETKSDTLARILMRASHTQEIPVPVVRMLQTKRFNLVDWIVNACIKRDAALGPIRDLFELCLVHGYIKPLDMLFAFLERRKNPSYFDLGDVLYLIRVIDANLSTAGLDWMFAHDADQFHDIVDLSILDRLRTNEALFLNWFLAHGLLNLTEQGRLLARARSKPIWEWLQCQYATWPDADLPDWYREDGLGNASFDTMLAWLDAVPLADCPDMLDYVVEEEDVSQ